MYIRASRRMITCACARDKKFVGIKKFSARDQFCSRGFGLLPAYLIQWLAKNQVVLPEYDLFFFFCPKMAIWRRKNNQGDGGGGGGCSSLTSTLDAYGYHVVSTITHRQSSFTDIPFIELCSRILSRYRNIQITKVAKYTCHLIFVVHVKINSCQTIYTTKNGERPEMHWY